MRILNFIAIILILAATAYAMYRYYRYLSKFSDTEYEVFENKDIRALVEGVNETFANIQKKNLREMNLSRAEYEKRKKRKSELRTSLQEAAYGNAKAKRIVKGYIKDIIQESRFGVTESTIDDFIPFKTPLALSGQDKFEILFYIFKKKYGDKGFVHMMVDTGLDKPVDDGTGKMVYDVTKKRIDEVYNLVMSHISMTYTDKLEVLSQRIFESFKGFGAADLLFEANVDEIDGGVSGIPKDGFDMARIKGASYSYDAIWVLFRGVNIHLSCIGFGSQDELVRVCNNVYKYDPPFMLSRKDSNVVTTMKDGSRIVVIRPPQADSYCFFARKFDSVASVVPENLIHGQNNIVPLTILKWLIMGQRNIAITGSQNAGKTTLLKSLISYIDTTLTIRLQELAFELSLRYAYPDRNIVSMQETAHVTAQESLNLQKKTNGAVNIIGEVAAAIQAAYIVQTAKVASLFTMFTHHAKTATALVEAIGNNLLELGLYSNKNDAFLMAANVINIDCHLVNVNGDRHIERITEIIPSTFQPYPSEVNGNSQLEADTREFYKRITDRELFTTRDIVVWQDGAFYLKNMPSDEMLADIRSKLSDADRMHFDRDLETISQYICREEAV